MHFARIEEDRGVLIVTPLVRELGAAAARPLRDVVGERVRGRSLAIVCLSHVDAVDCSGLAALVAVLKRMAPGGELRLACAGPAVRALLSATQVDEVFPLYENAAAALRP
jgi:anti-sigma B factor antagonist